MSASGGSSAPPLLSGLTGGAEPGGDVSPGVPEAAETFDGGAGGGVELVDQGEQLVSAFAAAAATAGDKPPGLGWVRRDFGQTVNWSTSS